AEDPATIMKLLSINVNEILIDKHRQRKTISQEDVLRLANSIAANGLIQPVVVRKDPEGNYLLVAGERRLRALTHLWFFDNQVRCGEFQFEVEHVPCIYQGDMDPDDAFEMELEENIRRVDLSWQERAQATAELNERRKRVQQLLDSQHLRSRSSLKPLMVQVAKASSGPGQKSWLHPISPTPTLPPPPPPRKRSSSSSARSKRPKTPRSRSR